MRTRGGALALLAAGLGVAGAADERPAVVSSVDLDAPFRPATVRVDGRSWLVYELHVTNFAAVDVVLTRVRVRTTGSGAAVIADLADEDLTARIGRPGPRRNAADRRLLGPGLRAVVSFWLPLPESAPNPEAVTHEVELDVRRPAGTVHTTVRDATPVKVSERSPVTLTPPLRGGPWVAIWSPLLQGGHRTAVYAVAGRARIPGRFAIDWIRPGADGRMESARPPRPDWNGQGAEVLAVADAVVATAMDDIADNAPTPEGGAPPAVALQDATGNYVALDLGGGRFAFYEHLKHGSVAVKTGDRVRRGQVVGRLGNSGSSSIGPHLHFHVADASSPLDAEGLPFVFERFEVLGAFESIESLIAGEPSKEVSKRTAAVRTLERPPENAVVRFR